MAGISASRKVAYSTLCTARERGAYVRELMGSEAGERIAAGLSAADRAFAMRLALGVTATRGTLDEVIDRFATKPSKIGPALRDALRLSTYEMLYLGKAPHVAVSQGVELVKVHSKGAAGLANAILRRVGESAEAFMAESDAHRWGLPAWLLERLQNDMGDEQARNFGQSCLEPAPIYLANVPMWISDKRALTALEMAGLSVERAGVVPGAWKAVDASVVPSCQLVREHQVMVSDYGAQLVAWLASPQPGDRYLEIGSGRGVKTVLLAGHLHRQSGAARIWALDLHAHKADVARNTLEAARATGITQVTGDARKLSSVAGLPPSFEKILVDAPCSGTGTLRRHPETVWSLTPEAVTSCAATQRAILDAAAPHVAPGGLLIYSTCSVLREEDEDVVSAFLASEAGSAFEIVPASRVLNDPLAADAIEEMSTSQGYIRTYPAPQQCDGHFCAILRRRVVA